MEITENYRRLNCSECGIVYYFPEPWCARASEAARSWICPNGHNQYFGESDATKLRRERDRLTQRLAEKDDEIKHQRGLREGAERQLTATRGVVTRIKNRVAHGVCPYCKRSFNDLARHMGTKHPGYAAEAAE